MIDSRYKILLLTENTHPDIAAYKSAIEKNKNYAVEKVNVIDFNGSFEAYQLVVVFGIKKNNPLLMELEKTKYLYLFLIFSKT